ncbi:MAG: beta-lactamase family protein [Frankiaceae bacterium]|nr:beta-lactamase family protein [Frankiaceae bacterium]
MTAVAARLQTDGRLPSLVAGITRGPELAWSCGRGDVDGATPDDDVQYRIGSITKTVTAIAVMRLRDEGVLSLDDPVERHVPGTPYGDRTVGQLLGHSGGLSAESPTQWWERSEGLSWAELIARLSDEDVKHPAGRRFHYSNLGYAVLGEVLSRSRHKPWADVLRDEVLLPLGMTRTTTRPSGRAAQGYAVHPWADVVLREPEHDAGAMGPAGQLWATLTDLGRFAWFLLGHTGDVLDPSTLEEMAGPGTVDGSSLGWSAYGLGLQVIRVEGRTYVGHGGSMPGFIAGVFVDPLEQTGAVAATNATSGLATGGLISLLDIVRQNEPHVVEPWRPSSSVDPETLELTGTWYWGTSAYGLRLTADGLLHLLGLQGAGRESRFRRRGDAWVGLDGYHAGETLRPVHESGSVVALDLGSFVFSRTPYDAVAPIPGGVDPDGWQPA